MGDFADTIERISTVLGVDVALAVSIASMEGASMLTARGTGEISMFHAYWNRSIGEAYAQYHIDRRVPEHGRWRTEQIEGEDDRSTRRVVEELYLRDLVLPRRDAPLALAAQAAEYREQFATLAREVLGPRAAAAIAGMTEDAARVWTQIRFSGIGNARTLLELVAQREGAVDLNRIITDESRALAPDADLRIHVDIARVRGMRATLFEAIVQRAIASPPVAETTSMSTAAF